MIRVTRPGLVVPVRVDPTGRRGPTPDQARGRGWRSPFRGWHVPAAVELSPEQRIVEAAVLLGARGGAVTGWAALRWCGGRWFDGSTAGDPHGLPVDLAVATDVRRRPGIVVCEEGLLPTEMVWIDGIPVTIPVRSVAYALRYARDVRAAVRLLDMAAYDDQVSLDEVSAYVGTRPREGLSAWTGVPQAREAVLLGDENAWSPQEVTMQLWWMIDAGLPRPLLNRPVFDRRGRHIGTPDLLDVEAGVIGEYEGANHLDRARRAHDVRREEAFRELGLECFTLMAGDSADRTEVVTRMHAARGRALWLPEEQRRWTIQPPPWWIPTVSVDQRRALTAEQRDTLLRHRRAA